MGISAEIGGYHLALFSYPLFWMFWLVEYDAIASEQRKLERVIPNIGIVD